MALNETLPSPEVIICLIQDCHLLCRTCNCDRHFKLVLILSYFISAGLPDADYHWPLNKVGVLS